MYAVLVKVRRDPARADEVLTMVREQVVPRSQAAPGFVKGTWFGDDKAGHGLMLFDSEQHAQQMAGMVSAGPGDAVQIDDVTVYKVDAEA